MVLCKQEKYANGDLELIATFLMSSRAAMKRSLKKIVGLLGGAMAESVQYNQYLSRQNHTTINVRCVLR